MMKRFATFAVACVVLLMAMAVPAAPAFASDDERVDGVFFGDCVTHDTCFGYVVNSQIDDCLQCAGGHMAGVTGNELYLGRDAVVSATGCHVVLWDTLDTSTSNEWDSPKFTSDCMDTISQSGRHAWHYYTKDAIAWDTVATAVLAHMCVYLYYNHSSTAGWSRCVTGDWAID